VKVSISISNYSWPSGPSALGDELGRVVRAADRAGIHTIWVPDHLIQSDPSLGSDEAMPEAYTTLGFLAGHSERVQLGTMVTAVTFRPPALLVKAVTTLDVLTGGRAWLGIGAGYKQDEAAAMGLPLPGTAERFERLEETLRLALKMWSDDTDRFTGTHYRLDGPVNRPQSVQRPHPPILIGGTGERKTLALAARYADACNVFDIPDGGATIRHKLDVLARHCAELGRHYDEIEKTVSTRLEPRESPTGFADRCARLAAFGIQHAVVLASAPWTEDAIDVLAGAARTQL
jgi:F420-dependent oxidoreductase-like protein